MGPLGDNRKELLSALLELPLQAPGIREKLRTFSWDSEVLVELQEVHVIKVLNQYINGNLGLKEIQTWAESIEGRDDIGFQTNELKSFIFELANPEIHLPIGIDWANRWLIKLQSLVISLS